MSDPTIADGTLLAVTRLIYVPEGSKFVGNTITDTKLSEQDIKDIVVFIRTLPTY